MEFIAQLWLPIVLSAVFVFIASSVIHMVVKWHNSSYLELSNEDDVRATVRSGNPAPGLYVIPYCAEMKEFGTPQMQKKFVDGPVAFVTVRESGPPSMGKPLALWFVYCLGVSAIAAYVASKVFWSPPTFGGVARLVGAIAFVAYAGGSFQQAIWMGKPWPAAAKEIADGLIYGIITGATFAWLWK